VLIRRARRSSTLASPGFEGVNEVARQGIEVDLAETDETRARAGGEDLRDLLANTVIENYAYELV
jgi:phosphoribosylformylglycinamidine (FGAM) synthase PurS component